MFFTPAKNVKTARTPTETIKTCCIEFFLVKFFISFVKLLNINLDEYSLFLSRAK